MTRQELLSMEIHTSKNEGDFTQIFRVFGGWIYNQMFENQDSSWQTTLTFVPEELNCNTKSFN